MLKLPHVVADSKSVRASLFPRLLQHCCRPGPGLALAPPSSPNAHSVTITQATACRRDALAYRQ